ncbi:MAG: hypothetical protein K6B72_00670 [Lachnospiraceae bacterium]|nr:hypothetical protein [Lachnospiraceae bacterium]
MKRKLFKQHLVFLLLCALLLCGCGEEASSVKNSSDSNVRETKAVKGPSSDALVENASKLLENAASEVERAGTEYSDAASENMSSQDGNSFHDAFARGDVENNGSYFVRVGNEVYIRLIEPKCLRDGATFGEFLTGEDQAVSCILAVYDTTDNDWDELFSVTGTGKLFACPGGFYLGNREGDDYSACHTDFIDIETGQQSMYCMGTPLGISESGEILAVQQLEGQFMNIRLFRDGMQIASLGNESSYYYYCGFAGEYLIAMHTDANEEYTLVSVDGQGKETQLGKIPPLDVEGLFFYPEPGQYLEGEHGEFYLGLGYYEGTGHFLSKWQALTATPGEPGSLAVAAAVDAYEEEYTEEPRMAIDKSGEMYYAAHVPGDLYTIYSESGTDLAFWNGSDREQILIKDFIPPISTQQGGQWSIVQDLAALWDVAFIISADVTEDEEYSIGWRTGYRMDRWHIQAIPIGPGSLDASGTPKEIHDLVNLDV